MLGQDQPAGGPAEVCGDTVAVPHAIEAERRLWERIAGFQGMGSSLGDSPVGQDHVDCEVWLAEWVICDPSRDTPMERGLLALGIPLERQPIVDASGQVPYLRLASFDEWVRSGRSRGGFARAESKPSARSTIYCAI